MISKPFLNLFPVSLVQMQQSKDNTRLKGTAQKSQLHTCVQTDFRFVSSMKTFPTLCALAGDLMYAALCSESLIRLFNHFSRHTAFFSDRLPTSKNSSRTSNLSYPTGSLASVTMQQFAPVEYFWILIKRLPAPAGGWILSFRTLQRNVFISLKLVVSSVSCWDNIISFNWTKSLNRLSEPFLPFPRVQWCDGPFKMKH